MIRTSTIAKLLLIAALSANLYSWKLVDVFYIIFFIYGIALSFKRSHKFSLQAFELRPSILTGLLLVWVLSNIAGYCFTGTMTAEKWNDILDLRWVLSFFACIFIGKELTDLKLLIKQLALVFGVVLIVALIWQWYHPMHTDTYGGIERLRGFYKNPNNFALSVLLVWAFLLGWKSEAFKNGLPSPFTLAHILFLSLVLYATFTRSAWLAMFFSLVFVTWMTKSKKILLFFTSALGVAILLFALNIFSFKERIMYSVNTAAGNSQALRLIIWKVSWNIFKDFPLFGVGFTENRNFFPEYYQKLGVTGQELLLHSHNLYLQILNDSGIIGFTAFFGVIAVGFVYFYKKNRFSQNVEIKQVSLAAMTVIVAFLMSSMTDCPLLSSEARNCFFLLMGVAYGFCLKPSSTDVA